MWWAVGKELGITCEQGNDMDLVCNDERKSVVPWIESYTVG